MRVPTDSPLRCKAHNRAGERCARWASPGFKVCHYHGGASTGRKTEKGRANAAAARITHGAQTTPETYLKALALADPGLFASAPTSISIGSELQFARARLAGLAIREGRGETGLLGPQLETLDLIRRLAVAQAANAPGAEASGAFTINIKVVGEDPDRSRPAHVGGAAPPSALVDAGGGAGSTASLPPAAPEVPEDGPRRGPRPYRAEDWAELAPGQRR